MDMRHVNWRWYGWKLLIVISVGHYFGWAASTLHSFGLFVLPVSLEFGWTRTQISLAHTLGTMTMVMAAPVVGVLVDRYGPKAVIVPSLAALGTLHCGLTFANGSLYFFYAAYIFLAIAGAGTIGPVYARLIFSWFEIRKGLALGILLCGAALSNILNPPLLTWIMDVAGWRYAYLFFGLMNLLIVLPLTILFVRSDPREMGLTRDGVEAEAVDERQVDREFEYGFTFREAIRKAVFWKLCIMFFALSFGQAAVVLLVPLLRGTGVDASSAALIASAFGVSMLAARLLGGTLMDHFAAAKVSIIIVGASAIGYALLLAIPGSFAVSLLAACLIGLVYGAESDFMGLFVVSYLGRVAAARVHTVIFSVFSCGSAAGIYTSGLIFDRFGNYEYTLMIALGTAFLAALLLLTFGPYPELPLRRSEMRQKADHLPNRPAGA